MILWCLRGTFSPGSLHLPQAGGERPSRKSPLPGFSPCGWIFHLLSGPLGWLLGARLGLHLWKSHRREKPHCPASLTLPGFELQPPWGGVNSEHIACLISAAWTHCSDKKDREGNRGGKSTAEKAELNDYELRGQRCELQRGSSHPLLLSPAQQFLGANMVLPPSLTPAFLELGAGLRLQCIPPWHCQCAMAAQIQHGNAAPAAPALMCGTEEIIFLFNDCITVGGGLGEGCHCTGPCLAGKRCLLGCSFLEKLKPKHYPV